MFHFFFFTFFLSFLFTLNILKKGCLYHLQKNSYLVFFPLQIVFTKRCCSSFRRIPNTFQGTLIRNTVKSHDLGDNSTHNVFHWPVSPDVSFGIIVIYFI